MTIGAPSEQAWPWLVQLGLGRAGFYSDSSFWDRSVDWYYRLLSRERPGRPEVGYRVEASDRIVPAWQNPHEGDIVADGPPGGGAAYYVLLARRLRGGERMCLRACRGCWPSLAVAPGRLPGMVRGVVADRLVLWRLHAENHSRRDDHHAFRPRIDPRVRALA